MKMSKKPLTPWIIAEESGKIVSAHCDCMAGLGESCSHVASLLWAIESGVRIRDSMTVTQKKAYWVIPNGVKEVPYAPVKNMDFVGKKRSLAIMASLDFKQPDSSCSPTPSPSPISRPSKSPTPALTVPDHEETKSFLASLASCPSKPAILSLVQPYSSNYVPKSLSVGLPMYLTELFKSEYLHKNYGDLLTLAREITITVTPEEASLVEAKTRSQSKSRLWFRMRTGRITASRFKSACRTNPAAPSISLIMSICHPELTKFKNAATCWGCEHELIARKKYESIFVKTHHHFQVTDCGFFINIEFPFIGASPDGLVTCTCCSDGICEIKVNIVVLCMLVT